MERCVGAEGRLIYETIHREGRKGGRAERVGVMTANGTDSARGGFAVCEKIRQEKLEQSSAPPLRSPS
jgi:hypothetical protein